MIYITIDAIYFVNIMFTKCARRGGNPVAGAILSRGRSRCGGRSSRRGGDHPVAGVIIPSRGRSSRRGGDHPIAGAIIPSRGLMNNPCPNTNEDDLSCLIDSPVLTLNTKRLKAMKVSRLSVLIAWSSQLRGFTV